MNEHEIPDISEAKFYFPGLFSDPFTVSLAAPPGPKTAGHKMDAAAQSGAGNRPPADLFVETLIRVEWGGETITHHPDHLSQSVFDGPSRPSTVARIVARMAGLAVDSVKQQCAAWLEDAAPTGAAAPPEKELRVEIRFLVALRGKTIAQFPHACSHPASSPSFVARTVASEAEFAADFLMTECYRWMQEAENAASCRG